MKFIALFIIFICISLIGVILGSGFKLRVKELQEFENAFYSLKNNITFMRTPISQALKSSFNKKSELGSVFNKISKEIDKGEFYNLIDVVKNVFEKHKYNLYLNHSDLEMIYDFFINLENNNIDSFENLFNVYAKRVDEQLKEAIEVRNKNNKIYSTLGIGIGAMIVIFLI